MVTIPSVALEPQTPQKLAVAYALKGWPCFPCRHQAEDVVDHSTGELEERGAKTPLLSNGVKGALTPPSVVSRAWDRYPDAMIGLPTGEKTGFFVLDIDAKPGAANGFDWLAEVEAEHGQLPKTARVTTPNGGMHIYFKHVEGIRNRGALGAGVDIRGEGGYVIGAGSAMADGRRYDWADDVRDIAHAPTWLLGLVKPKAPIASLPYTGAAAANDAYISAAIDAELAGLSTTPIGGRNNALNDSAFALGRWVAGGHVTESDARAWLQDVARGWGRDWSQCCKTIENGLRAGMLDPRHPPEPDIQTDNTPALSPEVIKRFVENSLRKHSEKGVLESQRAPTAANDNKPVITATEWQWVDPRAIPPREWIYGKHYIRNYVSITVSPGGVGKTGKSIVEALSMATGRNLLGETVHERVRVWLLNEDPREELNRRLAAACLHYGIRKEEIAGYLFVDSFREQDFVTARTTKNETKIVAPFRDGLAAEIKRRGIDVIIVDPFVSTHAVSENDNMAIDLVVKKFWAPVISETNIAAELIHHSKKLGGGEVNAESARGAVSLIGAGRSAIALNPMTADEASKANVENHHLYFRATDAKANMAPKSNNSRWYKLESVDLLNSTNDRPSDHVGVVTAWRWPSALEGCGVADLVAVQKEINVGGYRDDVRAANWAGKAVAIAMGLDADDDKERIKEMLKIWIKSGALKLIEMEDGSRKKKKFVVVGEWADRVEEA